MSTRIGVIKEVMAYSHLIISPSNYFAEQQRILMRQCEMENKKNALYVHYDYNYIKHVWTRTEKISSNYKDYVRMVG